MYLKLLFVVFAQIVILTSPRSQETHTKTSLYDITKYIDSLVNAKMLEYHVPGAVVVIVQDSQDVYKKAYGFADVVNQRLVDVDKTGFRIASVTKTFTATAALQLVERGLLDLHKPISDYLPDHDFTFLGNEPITMHQLLTHTAGFDLTDIGDAALKPEDVIPLETLVRYHMPDRVHPSGEVYSYSNFGYSLAGYIIQEISGMSYEEYIELNILNPLGMINSNLDQPLKSPHIENLALNYVWKQGKFIAIPRDYSNTIPGGGLVSTGDDMAKYMLFHLNGGQFSGKTILGEKFHQILTSQQYGSKKTQYGIGYAFNENGWTGRRCIEHTGAQLGFLTLMTLIPETGTGLFITHNNREDAGGFRYDLARAIFDTLLHRKPRQIDLPSPQSSFDEIAHRYTGTYQQMNYPHSSYEKIGTLMGFADNAYNVTYHGDGLLDLNGDKYIMMDEELFHRYDEKSPWNVSFHLNETGEAIRLTAGLTSYRKLSWYQQRQPIQILTVLSLVTLLFHFVREIYLRLKNRARNKSEKSSRWFMYWYNLTGALLLLGFIGILANFAVYQDQLSDYGVRISFKLALLSNTIGGVLAVFSPVALWMVWKRDSPFKKDRKWKTMVLLAGMIVAFVFWQYNIVGFRY